MKSETMSEVDQNRVKLEHVPRILAGVLALGGSCWGVLLSPWLFQRDASPLAWVVFGPGYIVTIGYIIRTFSTPPLGVCRAIWVASILVQGAWFFVSIWGISERVAAGNTVNEPILILAWWLFATGASVVGLLTEKAKPVSS